MKKLFLSLSLFLIFSSLVHAQWTTNGANTITSTSNSVGIGTTTPVSPLQVQVSNLGLNITGGFRNSNNGAGNGTTTAGTAVGIGFLNELNGNWWKAAIVHERTNAYGVGNLHFLVNNSIDNSTVTLNDVKMTIQSSGNVGIGTTNPQTNLHVVGTGTDKDGDNSRPLVGGGLTIQGNTGQRSTTSGAQLEFAIPTNVNNAGMWGQARIIAVNGTANNGEVRGKMILGTRRNFDKLGTGAQYYYGDDLVIDQAGNVGIGTTTPKEALSVNGNIRSKQITVELANWPDYVFKPDYLLRPLSEVKEYIDQNQHLPEIPSEQQIAKDGLNLGEMNKLLIKKVEELTLYLIEKDKQAQAQQVEIDELKTQMKKLIKP